MSENNGLKKYVAELIGTFVLVFIGCGSVVGNKLTSVLVGYQLIPGVGVGYVGIAFAFGLSLLALVYVFGHVSGCHVNPAVSLSMLVAGKMKATDTLIYIICQCVGAVAGAATLYAIALGSPHFLLPYTGLGQNGYDAASPSGFSATSAFIAEVVLTFIFVLVIHGATSEKAPHGFAGVAIGSALVLVHLVGIPITGTSVNPARSLGPAVIVGGTAISQLPLFWIAPIVGGVLAAIAWRLVAWLAAE